MKKTMKLPIYLDYGATTPVDPKVVEAMRPYFESEFGNTASRNHQFGWTSEEAVEQSRATLADALGAEGKEIVFTSGATEANNLAIQGAFEFYHDKGNHIITAPTEHKAVLDVCRYLEQRGAQVTYLNVDNEGNIDLQELEKAITDQTVLVSLMAANSEIGTLHPLEEIGTITRKKGVIFHCDATQAFGKIPLDVQAMNIDLLSASAHKIYGPKGVGLLYIRRKRPRVRLAPLFHGGGQERGYRSGTLNTPGIIGFAKAIELAMQEMSTESKRQIALKSKLHEQLSEKLDYVFLNGSATKRLPNNLNLSFAYVEGESLIMGIRDVAVSSGSACTSASLEPSYVLRALGLGDDLAHSSIRFTLGRFTTDEEIDYTIQCVTNAVTRLREMSPLYEMACQGIDLSTVAWSSH